MARYKNHLVVERLIKQFNGNQSNAAVAVGTSRQVINQWLEKGFIPPRWAAIIERVSGGLITATEVMETAIFIQDPVNKKKAKAVII